MKTLPKPLTIAQIAGLVGGEALGSLDHEVTGVADLADAGPSDAVFLENRKYSALAATAPAGCLFLTPDLRDTPCAAKGKVIVEEPRAAFAFLVRMINDAGRIKVLPTHSAKASIHGKAALGPNVSIGDFVVIERGAAVGEHTVIMPQVYIGVNAKVGRNCLIYPQVVIREDCVVGDGVIIHPGAVIGADGFGFLTDKKTGKHTKIPQIGNVIIEAGCEIGANVTIDRGAVGSTVVKSGTQIDNLVQIGHNAKLGRDCVVVAQTGIAGSTAIGNNVILAGQAGVAGHLTIGDGAIITAQTGVMSDVPAKSVLFGSPGRPHREAFKLQALFSRLPELFDKVKELEKKLGASAGK
ncbi:MAG: UDP-3-O-(3-hydroxymyristoyl)glucosamine N-acyltransferase [Elusimicrobia bacterium]|nr:UDP-3-O-(3-hydroxymyristoyl)glucosamine N-acyltransferase [Elusimicrobiota bacterium]